jgi:predicted Zn-dependent protease
MGRNQVSLYSEDTVRSQGEAAYRDIVRSERPGMDDYQNHLVNCVTGRILNALTADERQDYYWEVRLFERDTANAFALPGGKIGIYSGLFRYARNEHQLATVIAHEVAHVLSNHANEGATWNTVRNAGIVLAQVAGLPVNTVDMASQLGLFLPFNRAAETEADQYGLMLMARGGFDPEESIYLWRNMDSKDGFRPPELISTHPASENRMENLESLMSPAKVLYEAAFTKQNMYSCNVMPQ